MYLAKPPPVFTAVLVEPKTWPPGGDPMPPPSGFANDAELPKVEPPVLPPPNDGLPPNADVLPKDGGLPNPPGIIKRYCTLLMWHT